MATQGKTFGEFFQHDPWILENTGIRRLMETYGEVRRLDHLEIMRQVANLRDRLYSKFSQGMDKRAYLDWIAKYVSGAGWIGVDGDNIEIRLETGDMPNYRASGEKLDEKYAYMRATIRVPSEKFIFTMDLFVNVYDIVIQDMRAGGDGAPKIDVAKSVPVVLKADGYFGANVTSFAKYIYGKNHDFVEILINPGYVFPPAKMKKFRDLMLSGDDGSPTEAGGDAKGSKDSGKAKKFTVDTAIKAFRVRYGFAIKEKEDEIWLRAPWVVQDSGDFTDPKMETYILLTRAVIGRSRENKTGLWYLAFVYARNSKYRLKELGGYNGHREMNRRIQFLESDPQFNAKFTKFLDGLMALGGNNAEVKNAVLTTYLDKFRENLGSNTHVG